MKHYYNPMSRAITTDWMLKELGVEHEQIFVDFEIDETRGDEFRKINPMEKLPVLVDGGMVVTEVAAICAYLADKFPEKKLAPDIGSIERGTYYRYLFLAGNTLEPSFALATAGLTHPEPRTAGWGDTPRVLTTIEQLTPVDGWAVGEQFTAADVVFGGLLDSAMMFKWIEASPRIASYVSRIRQRPSYQASHQVLLGMIAAGE